MILDTASGRIAPNWSVRRDIAFFSVVAPYADGLPGEAILGHFYYLPHAELAARAPVLAEAAENLVIAIGRGWDLDGCVDAVKTALDL